MKIVVGVTASIASYRSPDLIKLLVSRGHEVRVILTRSATELVSARVLGTFSGQPVQSADIFAADHASTDHISAARWAECFLVYGATAHFLARYSAGLADDFLNLQLIASQGPVFLAPAMNPTMWAHPSVVENCATLKKRNVKIIDPIFGRVACGEEGQGHIADLQDIVECVEQSAFKTDRFLEGKKILISAGPMRSALDPVRFLQNRSSGQMGLELARAAQAAGAKVSVLLGPVEKSMGLEFKSSNFEHILDYTDAREYGAGLEELFPRCDWFFSAAAVLDFEWIAEPKKIERGQLAKLTEVKFPIRSVPDFVAKMAECRKSHQKVIAFAAESGAEAEILKRSAKKLMNKNVDALVANPVWPGLGPEAPDNRLWVLFSHNKSPQQSFGPARKCDLALPLLRGISDALDL